MAFSLGWNPILKQSPTLTIDNTKTMDQNYRATIPPQPTSRQSYRHAARQISLPAKARAKEYFANSVNPILNDFLASIATNRPDDVLAYMFAFSRKRLAERQLESSTSLDDVPESTSDNRRDQNNAASRIQARHRGRNDRERVAKLKEKLRKNDLLLAQTKEEAAKEAAADAAADAAAAVAEAEFQKLPTIKAQPAASSKAKKMGSLLMKAKQDGSLDDRVNEMEKVLG